MTPSVISEYSQLRELLAILRENGVTEYETEGLKLRLAPRAVAQPEPKPAPPVGRQTYGGRSIEQIRKAGLGGVVPQDDGQG